MMQYELMDRENDLCARVAYLSSRLGSLGTRLADTRKGLRNIAADIERFKMSHAPGADIEELEGVLSGLLLTHRTISCQIKTVEQQRRRAEEQHQNYLAALDMLRNIV